MPPTAPRTAGPINPIMKRFSPIRFALALGICFLFAFAGSLFTPVPGSEWYYGQLIKPEWNPPDWLFPPVWSMLFLFMAIALYLVTSSNERSISVRRSAYMAFGAQLLLNLGWSAAFFGLQSPALGLVVIVMLWIAILATIIRFKPLSLPAAWLLAPYLGWVSFASWLNFVIVQLNQR